MSTARHCSREILCGHKGGGIGSAGPVLFALVVWARRRLGLVHFNVIEHPIADWAVQQIGEAFPEDRAPRYLIRDRDGVCDERFRDRVTEVLTAPQSPRQNAFTERLYS